MVLFNHRLSRCTNLNVISAFDGITSMKRAGESDQSGAVVSVRWRLFPRLMKLIFGWRLRHRLGFLSDTCFSSSGRLYYLYLRGLYLFLCSIDYVSLNIDIAPVVLKFYFTFPDWTRQHPATNGGTGNCGPFFSTSHYFQAQLPTVFHRARRT